MLQSIILALSTFFSSPSATPTRQFEPQGADVWKAESSRICVPVFARCNLFPCCAPYVCKGNMTCSL